MSNAQTATERFLRHGVAGGWRWHPGVVNYTNELAQKVIDPEIDIEKRLLDPDLWRAAGRSLGLDDIATNPKNVSWLEHWHRLIDHLAAHPGDVEGYLEKIIGGKKTE